MVHIEGFTEWESLERQVREVALLHPRGNEMVYPYANAQISLQRIHYKDALPTSKYVLRENLALHTSLSHDLEGLGYDPLELTGALRLRTETDELHILTPPIVETTAEDGTYILDGAHRTTIGRWAGRLGFMAVHIVGIRPDCPSYARPNPWEDMRIRDSVPSSPEDKKNYRIGASALYCNFGPVNGSVLRKAKEV